MQQQQQQQQQQQRLYYQHLQDSMKRSSMLRRLSNSHSVAHFQNHYIPENSMQQQQQQQQHASATLSHLQQQQGNQHKRHFAPATLCAGNVVIPQTSNSTASTTLMELSHLPPQTSEYPHIVIGGQPFYLVPTLRRQQLVNQDNNGDMSYAYPEHCGPIYEEIDPYAAEVSVMQNFKSDDECSAASDQGELGSVTHNRGRATGDNSNKHRQFSQNSSDLSCSNSDSGINNPTQLKSSPPSSSSSSSQAKRRAQQPRVLVNPMVRDVMTEDGFRDTSFTSDQDLIKPTFSSPSSTSTSSSKVPQRSPATSSSNSSVYYYSDTLKKSKDPSTNDGEVILPPSKRLIRDAANRRSSSKPRAPTTSVDTKIVLAESKSKFNPHAQV